MRKRATPRAPKGPPPRFKVEKNSKFAHRSVGRETRFPARNLCRDRREMTFIGFQEEVKG